MSEPLDDLFARLAAAPADRSLDALDAAVLRSIRLKRHEARATLSLAPVRIASVALALAVGVTAGGAVATSAILAPQPYGTFSSSANLAPSTLLDGTP
jgi:hypothetical protein